MSRCSPTGATAATLDRRPIHKLRRRAQGNAVGRLRSFQLTERARPQPIGRRLNRPIHSIRGPSREIVQSASLENFAIRRKAQKDSILGLFLAGGLLRRRRRVAEFWRPLSSGLDHGQSA
jgi:hypothetical protein